MDDKLDLSILVNSCDSFEDCWDPFFKLFEKYWPDCNLPIILNTEYKVFDNKKVVSSKSACGFKKKLTWSEALLNALNLVDTEFILYLQEDYFIEEYVDVDSIRKAVNFLKLNNNNFRRFLKNNSYFHPNLMLIFYLKNHQIKLMGRRY